MAIVAHSHAPFQRCTLIWYLFALLQPTVFSMSTPPTQLPIDFKGQRYAGVYSVSGTLLIARVPGVSSRSAEVEGDEEAEALRLFTAILEDADSSGLL